MVSANGSANLSQRTARIADVSGALTGVNLPVVNQLPAPYYASLSFIASSVRNASGAPLICRPSIWSML
jgi:hypothetical protein